jgi:hypothetical protein
LILVASLALSAGVASRNWNVVQESAQERLARIEAGISELGGKVLDTASSLAVAEVDSPTPTPTPVVVLAVLPDTDSALAAPLQSDIVLAPTTVGAVGGVGIETASAVAVVTDEVIPTTEPTATETPIAASPTATALPTATEPPTPVPPTATPTATTAPPTHTPTVPATPTRAPATPTPQAAAAAAGAGATGGGGLTHAVQAGDNWFSIAQRYGITQEALAAYNNSQPSDILQVGQVLRVPTAGAAIPPPATPTPARPTAVPAAATPTPAAATPTPVIPTVAALAAPSLIAPMTGDGFTSGAQPVLSWRPVSGFGPQDYYYVLVRYTMRDGQRGYADDRVTGTSFTVPVWVYDVAAPPDRLATWSVQVRRMGPGNQDIEISPPSESRTFYWR